MANPFEFFTKTEEAFQKLKTLRERLSPKSVILRNLKDSMNAGLSVLDFSESGIYLFIDKDLRKKVLFWYADVQESEFKNNEIYFHCYGCQKAKEIYEKQPQKCRITSNTSLSFYIGVFSHQIQTKMFNDRPLNLCPKCSSLFLQHYTAVTPSNLKQFLQT